MHKTCHIKFDINDDSQKRWMFDIKSGMTGFWRDGSMHNFLYDFLFSVEQKRMFKECFNCFCLHSEKSVGSKTTRDPINFHWIFIFFCVPQKRNKVIQAWNDMRLSKLWQHFHFWRSLLPFSLGVNQGFVVWHDKDFVFLDLIFPFFICWFCIYPLCFIRVISLSQNW